MTGLEKITNQILEEAKTSAAAVLEAAQKEAGEILEEAKKACEAIEAEADSDFAGKAGDDCPSYRRSSENFENGGYGELFPDDGKNIKSLCTGGKWRDLFLCPGYGQNAAGF